MINEFAHKQRVIVENPKLNRLSSFRPNAVRAGIHAINKFLATDISRLNKFSLNNVNNASARTFTTATKLVGAGSKPALVNLLSVILRQRQGHLGNNKGGFRTRPYASNRYFQD